MRAQYSIRVFLLVTVAISCILGLGVRSWNWASARTALENRGVTFHQYRYGTNSEGPLLTTAFFYDVLPSATDLDTALELLGRCNDIGGICIRESPAALSLKRFERFQNIEWLELTGSIHIHDWESFRRLHGLRALGIRRNESVTGDNLKTVSLLSNCWSIDLNGTACSEFGLKAINSMSSLRELCVRDTGITVAVLERLSIAPHLKRLDVSRSIEAWEERNFKFNPRFPIEPDVNAFKIDAWYEDRELEGLRAFGRIPITTSSEVVQGIHLPSGLEWLDISGWDCDESAMRAIGSLSKLERLNLAGHVLSASELSALSSSMRLRRLGLANTNVDDGLLGTLLKVGAHLEVLDLRCTVVSTERLCALSQLPRLRSICVSLDDYVQQDARFASLVSAFRDHELIVEHVGVISLAMKETLQRFPKARVQLHRRFW